MAHTFVFSVLWNVAISRQAGDKHVGGLDHGVIALRLDVHVDVDGRLNVHAARNRQEHTRSASVIAL